MLTKLVAKSNVLALALVLVSQTVALTPSMVLAADAGIKLAGRTVFVNRAAGGGMSAEARGEVIQRNLDNALVAASDKSPASVKIVYVKGTPVITLGGYQVVTVDAANAKMSGTTPAILAQRWSGDLKTALSDSASVESYVAQLQGGGDGAVTADATSQAPQYQTANNSPQTNNQYQQAAYGGPNNYAVPQQGYGAPPQYRGHVLYAPAGLTIPLQLQTSISTDAAKPGDFIQANVSDTVDLGNGASIPAGSMLMGRITDAKSGGFFGRSGMMTVKFNRLRTPDGAEAPITAHIVGGLGKYSQVGGDESGTFKGEGMKAKFGQAAIRGAVGAGLGAGLGTAIGAIAARSGRGVGRGAWSGAAIGGGAGVAQSLLLRKGRDVVISSGTTMQLQLDAPLNMSVGTAGAAPYTGAF
jgi:hypothetical protein